MAPAPPAPPWKGGPRGMPAAAPSPPALPTLPLLVARSAPSTPTRDKPTDAKGTNMVTERGVGTGSENTGDGASQVDTDTAAASRAVATRFTGVPGDDPTKENRVGTAPPPTRAAKPRRGTRLNDPLLAPASMLTAAPTGASASCNASAPVALPYRRANSVKLPRCSAVRPLINVDVRRSSSLPPASSPPPPPPPPPPKLVKPSVV